MSAKRMCAGKIRRCGGVERAADSRTLGEIRLTCGERHVANEWEHDLHARFSFGAEGLRVGADGNEGEDGL